VPILDTNVLVRYLTEDDIEQAARAYALFEELDDGKRSVVLPEAVIAETVFVLLRIYKIDKGTIQTRLSSLLKIGRVQVPNKRVILDALDLFAEHPRLSIVDALCAAHAKILPDQTVLSFDRDFKNLAGVNWEEP
jgi:predicted nucleic acid-binding protein